MRACIYGILSVLLSACAVNPEADPRPLRRAHSHNDYERERPLQDALDHGFCSVEVDVHLAGGQLLVGHDSEEIQPGRTMQKLYLDPLKQRALVNGGRIYRGAHVFYLLIDVKTGADETYEILDKVLEDYGSVISHWKGDVFHKRAVRAVLSGNRAREKILADRSRYVGLDGRPEDIGIGLSGQMMPWISENWTRLFKWDGTGEFPAAERARLRNLVSQTKKEGRILRFWATPDRPAVWEELWNAGVGLINTDHQAGLAAFLRSRH